MRPEAIGEQIRVTPRTLALVMTHNYAHDQILLKLLLRSPARYIGVMGPRKRTERMLQELAESDSSFRLTETDRARLYTPVGLDIGASTPQEIALSIVAEMRAATQAREGGHLRRRHALIHDAMKTSLDLPPVPRHSQEVGERASAPVNRSHHF